MGLAYYSKLYCSFKSNGASNYEFGCCKQCSHSTFIAAHMFVFYFGILADDTPPVGLAAYAAAAISKGDPIRYRCARFHIRYSNRNVLPFLYSYLILSYLMIGIDNVLSFAIVVVISSVIAILLFAAATQGHWLVKNRWWETVVLLLLVAFMLCSGLGYFWDKIDPPL